MQPYTAPCGNDERLQLGPVNPFLQTVRSIENDAFLEAWSRLAVTIANADIDVAIAFVKETPKAVETLGAGNIEPWGEQALRIVKTHKAAWLAARAYLEESTANCSVSNERWEFFLAQAARISLISPPAAENFIRLGSRLCLLLNDEETEKWVAEGLHSSPTEAELQLYFGGGSLKALETRDGLASGIALRNCGNLLSLLCEAFLGRQVKIRSNSSLSTIKGFSGGAATDGRTVYLPNSSSDFALFKLMALHQSALLENLGGSYQLEKGTSTTAALHLEADRALLARLPNLLTDMRKFIRSEPCLDIS